MYVRKKRKKWQCLVRLKGVAVSNTFFSKSEASSWGKEREVEILNGTYLKDLKLTQMRLKDLMQLYLEKALHKSRRPKILKYEVEMLRRTPLARYTLAQLSPSKIAEFRDDRLKAGKSRSTVRSYLKLISRAITIGRKELNIPMTHNPVELVEKPKPNAPRERTLEHNELKKLFKACGSCSLFHFLSVFVEILYLTLCRRGELLRLKRQDVDFTNRIAVLQETKADRPRTIAISPRVVELLKSLPRTVDGTFFPVRSISAFEKAFARAVKRADITDFHMHDLRHCGAQHLIEDEGWNTIELMQQGGWTSASMAKRYANISPKYLAKKFRS
tara:strand:- start:2812 stop:3801 length:990 start_codon:yes stop_codon:yes gene_type:complete